ncbi:MAG: hypothetical protein IJW70_09545 [Clostridia bacterium]|nr:hypothetical protein [Clostridia bacterium]
MLKINVTSSEFRRFSLRRAGQKTAYIIIVPDLQSNVNSESEKSEKQKAKSEKVKTNSRQIREFLFGIANRKVLCYNGHRKLCDVDAHVTVSRPHSYTLGCPNLSTKSINFRQSVRECA